MQNWPWKSIWHNAVYVGIIASLFAEMNAEGEHILRAVVSVALIGALALYWQAKREMPDGRGSR